MIRSIVCALFVLLMLPAGAIGGNLAELLSEKAGDMVRVQLVLGAEAQAEVDKLHGKALSAEASAIGRYARMGAGDSVRPAEVWISRVESVKEAKRQTGLMVHKMYENPRSPFKNPRRIEHGSFDVYRFTGMGQVHLIWSKDDLVYWISAMPKDETLMLDVFCN